MHVTAQPCGVTSAPGWCPATATKLVWAPSATAAITKANVVGGERCHRLHPICRMGDCRRGCAGGASPVFAPGGAAVFVAKSAQWSEPSLSANELSGNLTCPAQSSPSSFAGANDKPIAVKGCYPEGSREWR